VAHPLESPLDVHVFSACDNRDASLYFLHSSIYLLLLVVQALTFHFNDTLILRRISYAVTSRVFLFSEQLGGFGNFRACTK